MSAPFCGGRVRSTTCGSRTSSSRLTREQLLEAVWAGEPESDNVVAVYVGYVRQKLEGGGEPRLLHTIRGAGYALREG